MYEALAGRPPFAEAQGMRILWAHLQDEPPDLRSVRSDISPELASALMRALEKAPDKRPQSAGEYARMLAEAAGSDGRAG
jgi:serine/threonine-protein kinase